MRFQSSHSPATSRVPAFMLVSVVLALLSAPLFAQELPSPQGYVNDFAGVIPSDDEAAMRGIMSAVKEQTDAEMAVVTVDSMAPYATVEDFGIALADKWGVGTAGGDDGVILIVAVQERKVRIEVGYGLEGAIPDGRAGGILDNYVLPDLRNNNYGAGLLNGVAAIAEVVADEYGVTLTGVQAEPRGSSARADGPGLGDIVYVIFFLLFVGGRWFFWPLLFAGRRRGFYGGGFGSSGGGSSSRFSGFGGGGFGGGGASRGF